MTHSTGPWAHPPRKPRRDWSTLLDRLYAAAMIIGLALMATAVIHIAHTSLRAYPICAEPC